MAVRTTGGDFTVNPGRFYGIYAVLLAVILAVLAGIERLGASAGIVAALFLVFVLSSFAMIGLLSRTTRVGDYFVGRRIVPAPMNGAVIAAGGFATLLLLVMVGGLAGGAVAAALGGWAAALAILAFAAAPALRKLGAYTIAEFLAVRFASRGVRIAATATLVAAAFPVLVAMLDFAAWLASRYLGFGFEATVYLGAAAILSCSLIGGMRALTWTEFAQAIILLAASFVPATLGAGIFAGTALPAGAIPELRGLALAPPAPLADLGAAALAAILFSFTLGSAMLPPTLMRAVAAADPRAARRGYLWALPALAVLGIGLPAYAAFTLAGAAALSPTIAALIAAGALSAALAAAAALAQALAAGLAHDLYYRLIDRRAPAGRRLLAMRILLVATVSAAAFVALSPPFAILPLAALGLGIAAGGLAPALFAAIWWRRCTASGAAAAMAAGGGTALACGLAGQFASLAEWPLPGAGLAAGLLGLPVGLLAAILVSLMSPAPAPEADRLVDEIRRPRGDTMLSERPA